MQHPILGVIEGAAGVNFDRQETDAWEHIAVACEEALTRLHPLHPQRGEFVQAWAACRRAAGLPVQRHLQGTG